MSNLKLKTIQIGNDATATNNFVLTVPAVQDGSIKLSRGNIGATTSDVLTIDAGGNIKFPANDLPCFSAYQTTLQSITSTPSKLVFQTEEFDITGAFDNSATSRFTPLVAGYYQINASVQVNSTGVTLIYLFKNGSPLQYGNYQGSTLVNTINQINSLVYMNGTTDYLEIWVSSSATGNSTNNRTSTFFQGHLVKPA